MKQTKAYCTSRKCNKGANSKHQEKSVSLAINSCPDCGSALLWLKHDKRRINNINRNKTYIPIDKQTNIEVNSLHSEVTI